MKYWLYTEEYPDGEIEDGTWGIAYLAKIEEDEEGEEVDIAVAGNIIYDTTGYLKPGFREELFDDAATDDEHAVIRFLFAQKFWG